jgi:dTDP-4-amino-4,6-dideoxygalactose transaminase
MSETITEKDAKFIIMPELKGKTFTLEELREIFKNKGEYIIK